MRVPRESDKRLLTLVAILLCAAPGYAAVPSDERAATDFACEDEARAWIRLAARDESCKPGDSRVSLERLGARS